MMLGMKLMGGGLEKFAGGKMKVMLGKITSNRFAGVGVGVAVTSIIQSSTATTVMLVGFVNVGLMTLAQAANGGKYRYYYNCTHRIVIGCRWWRGYRRYRSHGRLCWRFGFYAR